MFAHACACTCERRQWDFVDFLSMAGRKRGNLFVDIDPALRARIEAHAAQHDWTIATVVRRALRRYFAEVAAPNDSSIVKP